jgi:hypothetical protein
MAFHARILSQSNFVGQLMDAEPNQSRGSSVHAGWFALNWCLLTLRDDAIRLVTPNEHNRGLVGPSGLTIAQMHSGRQENAHISRKVSRAENIPNSANDYPSLSLRNRPTL